MFGQTRGEGQRQTPVLDEPCSSICAGRRLPTRTTSAASTRDTTRGAQPTHENEQVSRNRRWEGRPTRTGPQKTGAPLHESHNQHTTTRKRPETATRAAPARTEAAGSTRSATRGTPTPPHHQQEGRHRCPEARAATQAGLRATHGKGDGRPRQARLQARAWSRTQQRRLCRDDSGGKIGCKLAREGGAVHAASLHQRRCQIGLRLARETIVRHGMSATTTGQTKRAPAHKKNRGQAPRRV